MNLFKKKNIFVNRNHSIKSGTGFTVIELIVSVGIIAVISAVAVWNGRGFNDKTILNSTAEDISLAIRQTQNYGSSVRESAVGSNIFNLGYGIDFNKSNPNFAIVFVDKNANLMYDDDNGVSCDGSAGDECVQKIPLRNGVVIQDTCVIDSSNNVVCPNGWDSVQIMFLRPNLDATINPVNGNNLVGGTYIGANIKLASPLGTIKTIYINSTGQVSVQ